MESIDLTPVTLQCVDGTNIVITKARREHHVDNDHGHWTYILTILVTDDGEELEFDDASDLVHFDYVQNEVADQLFRVLDEPLKERWLSTASLLLKLAAAAAVEEVVKKAKEEVAEAA